MKRFIITLMAVAVVLVGADAQAGPDAKKMDSAPTADQAREILDQTRPLAEKGEASAQYNMGVLYDQGYGVEQDLDQARQWYLKAAEQHFAKAEHNLGIIYKSGKGVAADATKAAHWFRRASEDGEPAAQNNLAVMYVRGDGVPQDMGAAARWAAKAAAAGNESAIENLPEIVSGLPHSHVNGEYVNVRADSNKSADVVRQADSANPLIVLKRQADWTQVLFPDDYAVGWIANFLLADSQAPLADSDKSSASVAGTATAAQSAPSKAVDQTSAASTTDKSENDSRAEVGSAAADESAPPDTGADQGMTHVVGVSVANIRGKPSRSADVVFQAHRGDRVRVLDRKNGWSHVRTAAGRSGWVAGFLLTRAAD